jgi:hypothetical protein
MIQRKGEITPLKKGKTIMQRNFLNEIEMRRRWSNSAKKKTKQQLEEGDIT